MAGLADEIVEQWVRGTLTRALSAEYQTRRETVEFIIWRHVAPVLRSRRAA